MRNIKAVKEAIIELEEASMCVEAAKANLTVKNPTETCRNHAVSEIEKALVRHETVRAKLAYVLINIGGFKL